MKDLKPILLRIVCTVVLTCVICVSASFVIYWITKAFFHLESDVLELILVFIIFGMYFSITYLFMTSGLIERGGEKWENWVSHKLQRYELGIRYILRKFLIRLGVITVVGAMLVMILIQLTNGGLSAYTLVPLFSGLLSGFLGVSLISHYDISLIYFRNFRTNKIKYFKDLKHGLENYNKAVGFRFQSQKLYAITQYVKHVYSLELKEEINRIETNLDKIIRALENKNFGEIPSTLTELSKNSNFFIKKYGDVGIEIKAPFWTRTKEAITSSFHKALPQLIWLLIAIAIFLVLRMFIPIEISIP